MVSVNMNRNKQINTGILLSYLNLAISFLSQMVVTPIVIQKIGPSEHGVYTMAVSIVNYLNLLGYGISSAYVRFYSKAKSDGDGTEKVAKLNGSLFFIFAIIAFVTGIAGFFATEYCDIFVKNTFTAGEIITLKKVLGLLVVNLSLTIISSVQNSYIIAVEKFVFQKLFLLIKAILQPVLTVVLVFAGLKSFSLAVSMTAVTQFVNTANLVYVYKKCGYRIKFNIPRFAFIKELFAYCGFIFLILIVDQINWNIDKLLLGSMIGALAVSVYGVGAQFNDFFKALSTSVSSMYVPLIHKLEVSDNDKTYINSQLTEIMIKVGRTQFLIIMLAYSGFVFFGKAFINLWVGSTYYEAYYVALLILGSEIIPLIENIAIEIRRAKNKQKVPTVTFVFIAVMNLIVSIVLCKKYGVIGCAVGTAISMLLGTTFLNLYYHISLRLNMKKFWLQIFRTATGLIVPIIFGIAIYVFVNINTFIHLIIWCLIYTLIYVISVYKFSLTNNDKQKIISFLKKLRIVK